MLDMRQSTRNPRIRGPHLCQKERTWEPVTSNENIIVLVQEEGVRVPGEGGSLGFVKSMGL